MCLIWVFAVMAVAVLLHNIRLGSGVRLSLLIALVGCPVYLGTLGEDLGFCGWGGGCYNAMLGQREIQAADSFDVSAHHQYGKGEALEYEVPHQTSAMSSQIRDQSHADQRSHTQPQPHREQAASPRPTTNSHSKRR